MKKCLVSALLIALAAVSFLGISGAASAPESYAATAASIDEKAETVLKLTATSTVASAAISAIPDDTATPIAEKLADFTEYFLLILCTLYAEKYLLTIIGAGTFKILLPCASVLLIVGIFRENGAWKRLATKLALFGLALFIAIPTSIRVSDMVFETYKESIDQTISSAEAFSRESVGLTQEKGDEGFLASIMTKLSETVTGLSNRAADVMNNFIESLAVMIVTSCIIPILVLLFFLWLVKMLTGTDLSLPAARRRRKEANPEA